MWVTLKREEHDITMARSPSCPSSQLRGRIPHNNIMMIGFFILLQLVAFARAGVTFTNDEYIMYPNQPFTITWEGNRGPVRIALTRGPDADLQEVLVIASGLSGNKYTWTPPQTLKTDDYVLQIQDPVSTDYSSRFQFPAPPELSSTFVRPLPIHIYPVSLLVGVVDASRCKLMPC